MTDHAHASGLPLGSQLLRHLAEIRGLAGADRCALLNHPSHGNIGDHLIWVAQVHYLEQTRGISIRFSAAPDRYDRRAVERVVGDQPILLSGGGNLGDIWPGLQDFIETVVVNHPRNPLIILPQSISFRDPNRRRRAAAILQGHPDLVLMVRDRTSLAVAQTHFADCRTILAPDMASILPIDSLAVDSHPPHAPLPNRPWLALRRRDRERVAAGWESMLDPWRSRVESTDWLPLERRWVWGDRRLAFTRPVATAVREALQRRMLVPRLALARHRWLQGLAAPWRDAIRTSPLNRLCLEMVHDGCRQLSGRSLVITDRLHGVILASLLGVPSLAFDNITGKIHDYLATWSVGMPSARAVVPERLPECLRHAAALGGEPTTVC